MRIKSLRECRRSILATSAAVVLVWIPVPLNAQEESVQDEAERAAKLKAWAVYFDLNLGFFGFGSGAGDQGKDSSARYFCVGESF